MQTAASRGERTGPAVAAAAVAAAGASTPIAVEEAARGASAAEDAAAWSRLHRDEAALVAGAHPEARAAFAGGRACAHRALARLGAPDAPLLRVGGAGPAARAPAWPRGFVGSISHTRSHCAAAVASATHLAALGLDVEIEARVTPEVLARVCTPDERRRLDAAGVPPALAFAAKEAFYKAWSPLDPRPIGFRDVEVDAATTGRLEVRFTRDAPPTRLGAGPCVGGFAVRDGLVAAVVVVPATG